MGYKVWYTLKERNRNVVGLLVDDILKEDALDVKREREGYILC